MSTPEQTPEQQTTEKKEEEDEIEYTHKLTMDNITKLNNIFGKGIFGKDFIELHDEFYKYHIKTHVDELPENRKLYAPDIKFDYVKNSERLNINYNKIDDEYNKILEKVKNKVGKEEVEEEVEENEEENVEENEENEEDVNLSEVNLFGYENNDDDDDGEDNDIKETSGDNKKGGMTTSIFNDFNSDSDIN